MASKFSNASFINFQTFEEMEAEYQAAIAKDRRERRNSWIAAVIVFIGIGLITYFS